MAIIKKSIGGPVEDVSPDGRLLIAINSIGVEDTDGDISMSGSFDKTLKEDIPRMKWFLNHDPTLLLGVPIEGKEEDGYVKMSAQLNMKKQLSRDILSDYELYAEHGKTLEHSVGVEDIVRNKANLKEVAEWKMWEFSTLTHWGANEFTPLLEIKSVDDQIKMLEKAVKKTYSDERLSKMEGVLSMLRKAILGELIVKCPCCGLVFDYNSVEEITLERRVLDSIGMYTSWLADDIVYQEVQKLEPEIRSIVTNLATGLTMKKKSIEDVATYVHCPKCYTDVRKFDAVVELDSIIDGGIIKGLGTKLLSLK